MNFTRNVIILAVAAVLTVIHTSPLQAAAPRPVWADSGMVVSAHPLASQIGLDILKSGGNAVDAAVATAFALGVVEGYSSGIGGGSFTLLHLVDSWETIVMDAREKAPLAAREDMYVDKQTDQIIPELSVIGVLAGAVPGHLKGLSQLLDEYGTMSLGQVMEPAIALADTGFELSQTYIRVLEHHRNKLIRFPSTFDILFHADSTLLGLGERLIQYDLANTYRIIADEGKEAFYHDEIASKIVHAMKKEKGLITLKDLKEYSTAIREPVMGTYHGFSIYSMPPPSSGGAHLIQMLNILERYDLGYLGHNSSETIHLMAEAMKFAFADRSVFMGDPDFADIPLAGLLSKAYADSLSNTIFRFQAAKVLSEGDPLPYSQDEETFPGGKQTTHFSVLDQWGNMVAMTATINMGFGSGYVIPGTGIFLNNEMDDFSSQPGVPNYFGLLGAEANAITPSKRPLSSMTPTFVFYDGAPFMILGSPGGPRIITTVLQVILNVIDHEMTIQAAVDAPRIHHQWLPDRIYLESGIPYDVIQNLILRGHKVRFGGSWSAAQAILIDLETGLIYGGTDSRVEGGAKGY
ncbi:gamma-glutamyltransferase [candidate division LCP-89 bacterium B3_LCP]|uniref:Glutathione hydrolase proenzyme n=1 Tax=candidate division LCP-89 bacterium B3_LCP TaxID=2012998 RepID=A0A532V0S6_UNCL8|nr:MAG: gamma-glutamyltransferase [candidate division LCP-89 bacterium B3_LCP]